MSAAPLQFLLLVCRDIDTTRGGEHVDITALLGAPGAKTTFKIPFACFQDAGDGLDFTNINAPFQLQTTQPLDFTFAEVQWVQGAANDPDAAHCPTPGVATRAPVAGKAVTAPGRTKRSGDHAGAGHRGLIRSASDR